MSMMDSISTSKRLPRLFSTLKPPALVSRPQPPSVDPVNDRWHRSWSGQWSQTHFDEFRSFHGPEVAREQDIEVPFRVCHHCAAVRRSSCRWADAFAVAPPPVKRGESTSASVSRTPVSLGETSKPEPHSCPRPELRQHPSFRRAARPWFLRG